MQTLNRLLVRIFAFGAGLSMALVFAIIFFNALRRYAFGKSWEWGEELPIYLTIYGVMFGIAMAYLQDRHIRFTVLTDLLPAGGRKALFIATDIATVAVGAALAWSGWLFATRRGEISSSGLIGTAKGWAETTGIEALVWFGKVGTWQFAIPVGGVLLLSAASVRLAERLFGQEAGQ